MAAELSRSGSARTLGDRGGGGQGEASSRSNGGGDGGGGGGEKSVVRSKSIVVVQRRSKSELDLASSSSYLKKPATQWTVTDVGDWLGSIGLDA